MIRPLLFFSLIVESIWAQPWSLQQCVNYAIDHNLQVKQTALNVDQTKILQDQSYASFLPTVNGQVGHNYYWGRTIDPYTNSYKNQQVQSDNFGISSSVVLFDGFQLQNSLGQSKLNYLASQKDLDQIKNDISLNVVASYLQVLYNQDVYAVLSGQVNATTDQRNRMKRMYEIGSASKANYLDLEAQLANDSASLVAGQNQVEQSVLSLKQLLELKPDAVNFTIEHPVLPDVPELPSGLSAESVFASALLTQPQIKGSEFRLQAAEKGLSIAKGSRSPRLFLSGSWNTNYATSFKQPTSFLPSTDTVGYTTANDLVIVPSVTPTDFALVPFKNQFNQNRGTGVGVTLQLPVFNGWSVRTNVERARINVEQSRLNNELTRNNLFKSVQQAVLDAVSARRKYDATLRSESSLKESAEYSRQRFELGLINTYEYALSKNNLARAEANLLQAKYDYIFRLKILDFYQGKPLTF
jgi:outer membrane protein